MIIAIAKLIVENISKLLLRFKLAKLIFIKLILAESVDIAITKSALIIIVSYRLLIIRYLLKSHLLILKIQ